MSVIDTVRPASTTTAGGWTAVGAASLHAATSDNSDASYALGPVALQFMTLACTAHTPPAGHERHQIRVRARARADSGSAQLIIRPNVASQAGADYGVILSTTITDLTAPWLNSPFSLAGTSAATYSIEARPAGAVPVASRVMELYLDVDCRAAPTFTPQVLDAEGNDQAGGTVTVSNLISFVFDAPSYDGLSARNWTLQVHTDPGGVLVFESSGIGTPPSVPAALTNGDYIASYQTFSTIRVNDAYASTLQTVSFTMDASVPNAPVNLTATPTLNPPSIEVCWEAPADTSVWTEPTEVYAEITRTDCNGTERIALVPDGLSGCWTDRFMSLSSEGVFCGEEDHQCEVCYDIRYWGYTDVAVTPPTDPIPAGVIFAWPSTVASIPSNWTRVAAMDGRYPKGIPDGVTNPGTTGGSATHVHTTPGHLHSLDHLHTQGNTGVGSAAVASSGPHDANTASHIHARATTSTADVDSSAASPAASAGTSEQSRKEVIFVSSDGVDTAVPAGMLAIAHQTSPPSGWVVEDSDGADASTRPPYWKGAAAAGNGSLNFSEVVGHDHAVAVHAHSGNTHSHTSALTSLPSATATAASGFASLAADDHRHATTILNAPMALLGSASGGTSGLGAITAAGDVPFRYTNFLESVTGSQFVGLVGMWQGTLGTIPAGWLLCDGTAGTPNLLDTYPRFKGPFTVNTTGGGSTHGHSTPNHTHTTTSHQHAVTIGNNTGGPVAIAGTGSGAASVHNHTASDTNPTTPTVGNSSSGATSVDTLEPAYIETAYIMLAQGGGVGLDASVLVTSEPETICADPLPNPTPGNAWIRGAASGDMSVCPEESYGAFRPFGVFQPIGGGRPTVTTGTPGGRDYNLSFVVESEADQVALEAILAQPLVFYQPVAQADIWLAPNVTSATVTKVKRLRTLTVDTIAVNPQPVADPATTVPFPTPTSP